MHELEVPLPLAGLEIDGDKAFGKEVVTWPVAAVVIGCGCLDRQVHEPELFVDADLCPDADVAIDGPGVVLPRLMAVFARIRNRVEPPDLFASPHVERAHEPFRVVVRRDRGPLTERRSDNDDVAGDGGRRVNADLPRGEIDLLVHALDHADFQVEHALVRERLNHGARLCVELHELIARRHVNDAFVAFPIGPVRHAAPGQLPRRYRCALSLAQAV